MKFLAASSLFYVSVSASPTPPVASSSNTPTPYYTPKPQQVMAAPSSSSCITPQPSCANTASTPDSPPRLNQDIAANAAIDYCTTLFNEGVVLTAQNSSYIPYTIANIAENNADMMLTVAFDIDYCPIDHSITVLDFKALGQLGCYLNFFYYFVEFCSQGPGSRYYKPPFTLRGGVVGGDCGIWTLSARYGEGYLRDVGGV